MNKKITHEQARQYLENKIKDGSILEASIYNDFEEETITRAKAKIGGSQ